MSKKSINKSFGGKCYFKMLSKGVERGNTGVSLRILYLFIYLLID